MDPPGRDSKGDSNRTSRVRTRARQRRPAGNSISNGSQNENSSASSTTTDAGANANTTGRPRRSRNSSDVAASQDGPEGTAGGGGSNRNRNRNKNNPRRNRNNTTNGDDGRTARYNDTNPDTPHDTTPTHAAAASVGGRGSNSRRRNPPRGSNQVQVHEVASEQEQRTSRNSRTKPKRQSQAKQPKFRDFGPKSDSENLRIGLTADLLSSAYECMICYDNVLHKAKVWTCSTCYGVFHLDCISEWASRSVAPAAPAAVMVAEAFGDAHANAGSNDLGYILSNAIIDAARSSSSLSGVGSSSSSSANNQDIRGSNPGKKADLKEWRCPGCQTGFNEVPSEYTCFCGKMYNPPVDHMHPHSCGNTCAKNRGCRHVCPDRCHPGPCDPCENIAPETKCHCGKHDLILRCKDVNAANLSCGEVCGKKLSCGKHTCAQLCHEGRCSPCGVKVEVTCKCGKETRAFSCGNEHEFDCEIVCDVDNICKNHHCEIPCHPSHPPLPCRTDPSIITTCYCGQSQISDLLGPQGRESCLDPIPTCNKICNKKLPSCEHKCAQPCHEGTCPPCEEMITVTCNCGNNKHLIVQCSARLSDENGGGFKCNKLCTTTMSCKRHRCHTKCCTSAAHYCSRQCERPLSCGLHTCTYECGHRGKCHTCYIGVSFEPLLCNCGRTEMEPPIPCNSPLPRCPYPCQRQLPCGHEHTHVHECHGDDIECPKCMVFVDRKCKCGKTTMRFIPCSRKTEPTCGNPCEGIIEECGHKCQQYCHIGPCGPEKGAKKCSYCLTEQRNFYDSGLFLDSIGSMPIIGEYMDARAENEVERFRRRLQYRLKKGEDTKLENITNEDISSLVPEGTELTEEQIKELQEGVSKDVRYDAVPSWSLTNDNDTIEALTAANAPVTNSTGANSLDPFADDTPKKVLYIPLPLLNDSGIKKEESPADETYNEDEDPWWKESSESENDDGEGSWTKKRTKGKMPRKKIQADEDEGFTSNNVFNYFHEMGDE